MEGKKYIVTVDKLVEAGIRHLKGQELKIQITEERAQSLIAAGYISEVGQPKQPEPVKPEEKAIESPEDKMITGEETTKKGSTGKGAKLLNKFKKHKE